MFGSFFRSTKALWLVYSLAAVLTAWQKWSMGFNEKGFTKYENYRIFKYSWNHLLAGENPYGSHPETWDLYKYSPAFAVLMAPFSVLPDWLGVALWNLINALPLLFLLLRLPEISQQKRMWMAWLVLPELLISLQNTQSNGLTAALLLSAWVALDRGKAMNAAFAIMGGAFLKLFGIFAGLFLVFYRASWWKTIGFSFVWGLFLLLLPLPLLGWEGLWRVYYWWWELLRNDHSASLGLSVVGWLDAWFGVRPDKVVVTVIGFSLQLGAVIWAFWKKKSIVPVVASVLIWVVIFNHKAESPTFIIAMLGAAIWYFSLNTPGLTSKWSFGLIFVCSSLTPTDLFPSDWNRMFVQPYVLKAAPYIFLWVWLLFDLFIHDEQRTDLEVS